MNRKKISKTEKVSNAVLEISKKALDQNLKVIQSRIKDPKCKILIPVKANAYGCGSDMIIQYFNQNSKVDILGVANVHEAKQIRYFGWKKKILLLGGFYSENINMIFQNKVIPSITDIWQLKILNSEAKKWNLKYPIHIKWDTGMGRMGLVTTQKKEFIDAMRKCSYLKIKGMFTHFPCSDIEDHKGTRRQLTFFLSLVHDIIECLKLKRKDITLHTANSYALLNYPDSYLDMVRPGLFFYGYFKNLKDKERLSKKLPLSPCLKLSVEPISYRTLSKGSKVSYDSVFTVKKDAYPTAVLPIGYADGIPWALSNKISFENYPLLGKVTMDQIILGNVTPDIRSIEVLGKNSPPLELWSDMSKTISYEIMTKLGNRLKRNLVF